MATRKEVREKGVREDLVPGMCHTEFDPWHLLLTLGTQNLIHWHMKMFIASLSIIEKEPINNL